QPSAVQTQAFQSVSPQAQTPPAQGGLSPDLPLIDDTGGAASGTVSPGAALIPGFPGGNAYTVPTSGALGTTRGASGTSGSAQDFTVPRPDQINPMVWDSLGPVAQQLILSAASAGKTPQGAYDPQDFLRILNAARPKGTASGTTQMRFATPMGAF